MCLFAKLLIVVNISAKIKPSNGENGYISNKKSAETIHNQKQYINSRFIINKLRFLYLGTAT